MNPFKHGYTDSLFKRQAHCIFSSWHEAQQYLQGYLFGQQMKEKMGI